MRNDHIKNRKHLLKMQSDVDAPSKTGYSNGIQCKL